MFELHEIGERLRTQDNRITEVPIFIVQQRRRIYGIDRGYTDQTVWLNAAEEYAEATPRKAKALTRKQIDGKDTGDWMEVGYIDIWEFVTACFTEAACERFIEQRKHHLTDPRIYADTGFCNWEWQAVRDHLMAITSKKKEPAL